jgi:tetratricopeptide (TPR) repeat protein
MARAYYRLELYTEAAHHAQLAADICEDASDARHCAEALDVFADACEASGDPARAREARQRAIFLTDAPEPQHSTDHDAGESDE